MVLAASCDDDERTGETTRPPDATNEFISPPVDTGGPVICPSATFKYKEDELTQYLGGAFRAPTVTPGACTSVEIATFDKNLRTATASTPVTALKKDISDGCTACLVSTTSSTSWQLVVSVSGKSDTDYIVNYGACHSALSTSTPQTCGRTVLYDALCGKTACKECEPSALESCLQKVRASSGECFEAHDAITTACPDFPKTQPKCGTSVTQHAHVLCGPTASPDAGITDANDDG